MKSIEKYKTIWIQFKGGYKQQTYYMTQLLQKEEKDYILK